MPLIRIDVIEGRTDAELAGIGDAVHHALVTCFGVPARDRFQVITDHRRGRLIYDPAYLGVNRTDGIVVVQVFFSTGRSTEQKQEFYALVARGSPSERPRGRRTCSSRSSRTCAATGRSGTAWRSTSRCRKKNGGDAVIPSERSESRNLHRHFGRSAAALFGPPQSPRLRVSSSSHEQQQQQRQQHFTRSRGDAETCSRVEIPERCRAPLHPRPKNMNVQVGIQPVVAPRPFRVLCASA